jgi:hypothetical protein
MEVVKKLDKKSYVIHKCIPYLIKYENSSGGTRKDSSGGTRKDSSGGTRKDSSGGTRKDVFTPDFNKLTCDDYLNQLVNNAHKIYYKKICHHNIDFENPDQYYFIDLSSIHSCNGWFEYNDEIVYDEEGIEITEPCCNKRFFTGVSNDILQFDNSIKFSLNTKTCLCQDKIILYL